MPVLSVLCLLSRRRDSLPAAPGLAQPMLGGWVAQGGDPCPGEYSPPRASQGCTLLPPTLRLSLWFPTPGGEKRVSALACVNLGVTLTAHITWS